MDGGRTRRGDGAPDEIGWMDVRMCGRGRRPRVPQFLPVWTMGVVGGSIEGFWLNSDDDRGGGGGFDRLGCIECYL